ncbi:MAG TPA: 2-amino-4-hydroxy-6-hydroxymethyldihydropteridine diphosphokinase [Mycobacteriales bacterium]|nr:2-amino-4-hydroxy-6-hydroxymethyldihydropteridine diphosphokinase [Mycobacteriales bacterium]
MVSTVVSLGSNLGDRSTNLLVGLQLLAAQFAVRAVSPVYETAPVGVVDQPPFLNCVAILETDDVAEVLEAAQRGEQTRGRLRRSRWGPRTLDVDVVSADGVVSADPRLTLPHPRAHDRAFVLVPWLDIDPDAVLPTYGPVRLLAERSDRSGLQRWRG